MLSSIILETKPKRRRRRRRRRRTEQHLIQKREMKSVPANLV